MPIVSAPEEEIGQEYAFCLGIKPVGARESDQRHCGIIYRPSPDSLRFLHLAFHVDLRDEDFDRSYWWAPSGLDRENELFLAAVASLIHQGNPAMPYGFDADGMVFDKDTGRLQATPPGKGLTCATFVLAVFRTYGFEPLLVFRRAILTPLAG